MYREIVEGSSLGILFADREGKIRLWNRGCEAIFGFRAEEALGESMDIIVPEKHRTLHWEGYFRVMGTGETRYGSKPLAVPALTKDGRRISIEFNIVLVRDAAGQVAGAAATIQDVSERWQREKDMKRRLAELEAKAQEVRTT